jgi:hypothetical protein
MLKIHRRLRVAGFAALVMLTGAMFTSAAHATEFLQMLMGGQN